MQGSYILLAALGVFILIGGAKRVLKSLRMSSIIAVVLIIAIIIGNIFTPIGNDVTFYIGTLILTLLCIIYLLSDRPRVLIGSIGAIVVVSTILILYRTQIIERFNVGELPSFVMIIAGCSITSFILSKTSGQAFAVAVLSIVSYGIITALIYSQAIVIGDVTMFDLIIYSALGAVLLNEIVHEFVSLFSDRSPNLQFEAGEIDENIDDNEINRY